MKDKNVHIIFNKEFFTHKICSPKIFTLQYGGYNAIAQDMVLITTATLTVASGHEQLETVEVDDDSILYMYVSVVVRYDQWKSLALVM